ncbi:hypothetical protein COEREDRAFT_83243 [Coemansia reversa NRRL 1564]|uniref:Fungal-type protein kinase domain-containing protein n=1 Tax=Coemansia reversa (strain ATCC 12441 / NRRL 1564) TaxID=763665 RepID=A0A2G5B424_COERN|nr:hypothetical protein COEREDRAFT_83243 [Coemansia reversa NRRL 1564]|eukprot:PIA13758.1 hypothetical protein COEREDRAFT_83243 [Coemansia reversa NRRL 1564]
MLCAEETPSSSDSDNSDVPFFDSALTPRTRRVRKSKKQSNNTSTGGLASISARSGVKNTPQKSNPSHRSNPQYRGLSDAEFTTMRRKEMEDEVKTHLIENVTSVVDNAQPRELQKKALAAEIAKDIAQIIEAMVSSELNPDAPATNNNSGGEDGILNTGTTLYERQAFSRALPWICSTNNNDAAQRTEQPLYDQISAFILLVAHLLKRLLTDRDQVKESEFRLILPYEKTNVTPDGADDSSKIDIALRWRSMKARVEPQPDLRYQKIMAVGEIKRDAKGGRVKGAYTQLFDYTRNIYYCQIDRRFAWGLICCGSVVNACIFGNYHAFASPDIDMTTTMGRFEFIRLLVGWSLCSMHQLGYDETIQAVKGLGCYRIMVPSVDNPALSTAYYTNEFVMGAEQLFGRHCRCLLATDSLPTEKVTEDRPIKATVVIKDSWTIYSAAKDLQSQGNDSGSSSISVAENLVLPKIWRGYASKVKQRLYGQRNSLFLPLSAVMLVWLSVRLQCCIGLKTACRTTMILRAHIR